MAAVLVLSGCTNSSEPPSTPKSCKTALELSDKLLLAAADGMTAYEDLIRAYDARDYVKGKEALDRIDRSNATVDQYGDKYKSERAKCLGVGNGQA